MIAVKLNFQIEQIAKLILACPAVLSVTTGKPVSTYRKLVVSFAPLATDLSHCNRRTEPTATDRRCLPHRGECSILTVCLLPRTSLWKVLLYLVPLFPPYPRFS